MLRHNRRRNTLTNDILLRGITVGNVNTHGCANAHRSEDTVHLGELHHEP